MLYEKQICFGKPGKQVLLERDSACWFQKIGWSFKPSQWENGLVLQVLGELLSQHILQNYGKFVKGIDSVSSIEEELRTALDTVAAGRATLAHMRQLSNTDVCIAQGAIRKRRIASVLDALKKLKATRELPNALRYS